MKSVIEELDALKALITDKDGLARLAALEERVRSSVKIEPAYFNSEEEVPQGIYSYERSADLEVKKGYRVVLDDLSEPEVRGSGIYEVIEETGFNWIPHCWLDLSPSSKFRKQDASEAFRQNAKRIAAENEYPAVLVRTPVNFNLTADSLSRKRYLKGEKFQIIYNVRGIVDFLVKKSNR